MQYKNKIVYSGHTFLPGDIKSVNLRLASSLLSRKLEANTISTVVKTADKSIVNFSKNTPLKYFYRDRQRFLAYVQSVDRIGPDKYRISGISAIGLLTERLHTGGIYTGQTAETVIREIVGAIPFTIKGTLKGVKLYGWLPYAKPPERSARDNLVQVLFSLGAAVKTDLDGVLRIEPLWNGVSGEFPWERIYKDNAGVERVGAVSSVSVTEHHYMVGTEEAKLFEGEAVSGDIITFSEPMHSLSATGFSILASGANYAKLSTGSGVLTGKKYIHNTRQISKTVNSGAPENIETIDDATLVSLINSDAVAERMAAYYKCRETIVCDAVLDGQSPGDVLNAYNPYDKTNGPACLESLDISTTSIMRGTARVLSGYAPKQVEQVVTYDQHQVITSSRTVTLPDGVTSVRAVLIGGGTGGSGGQSGSSGTAGSGSSSSGSGSSIVKPSTGQAGKGGNGGGGGSGGSGGRIASFEIKGDSIKTISISIGSGGSGGSSNGGSGSPGGATTITVNGVTYSSNSGAGSGGYQDLVTGTVYGSRGGSGNSGAKGGDGSTPWGTPDSYYTEFQGSSGSAAGSNRGGSGGYGGYYGYNNTASCCGGGGGGGGAYSSSGSSGGTAGGKKGGSGGTGASGTKPSSATHPGNGGTGGNGGGGGGGGGGTYCAAGYSGSISTSGGSAGSGGSGGPGGNGAPGCVILYYGVPEKIKSGSPVDENQIFWLDKFGRLLVT